MLYPLSYEGLRRNMHVGLNLRLILPTVLRRPEPRRPTAFSMSA